MTGSNHEQTPDNADHAPSAAEAKKRDAAERALELVESGMVMGLGTGSTARYVTLGIARRLAEGSLERIQAVPTSEDTRALAEREGIPLIELPPHGVDLAIDGMDEVTADLDAIKGLGGALLREKIVAMAADRFILIGDDRKPVTRLGERSPVPVEILPFGRSRTIRQLHDLGVRPALREEDGLPYLTDNGNMIVDCALDAGLDTRRLAGELSAIPGVLEHGLFLGIAVAAYIATDDGVRVMTGQAAS